MRVIEVEIMDGSMSLSKAMNKILKTGKPVIITKSGRYKGIIDDKILSEITGDPKKIKCEKAAKKAPVLDNPLDFKKAYKLFYTTDFKTIVVIIDGVINGIINKQVLLEKIKKSKIIDKTPVNEIMSSPVITCEQNAKLSEVKKIMQKNKIRRVVITKNNKLVGLVSVFDIAVFFNRMNKVNLSKPAKEFMTEEVEIISEKEKCRKAISIMLEKNISSLIVIDEKKKIQGIVTIKDIVANAISKYEAMEKNKGIEITGVPENDLTFYPKLYMLAERIYEKYSGIFGIKKIKIRFKYAKTKSRYLVKLNIMGKEKKNLEITDWKFENCIKKIKSEIKNLAERTKKKRLKKRKIRRFED